MYRLWPWKKQVSLIILLYVMLIYRGSSADNKTIYFMAAGPLPDTGPFAPSWAGGTAAIHAVKLARDHINNRPDILPGYRLELIVADSGCNIVSKYAIAFAKHFIEQSTDKVIAGIVGPGCSDSTLLLAPVLARKEVQVIQIAPSATSSELLKHNTTFRIFSTALIYVEEFRELARKNNWHRVALLYDGSRELFRLNYQSFLDTKDANVTVSYESPLYPDFFPISEIRTLQTRVVFAFVSGGVAGHLMCIAYHLDMIYPTFQWIFHDRSLGSFEANITASHNGVPYTCSDKQMREAMNGIILNSYIFEPTNKDQKSLPVNLSYNEYYQQFNDTLSDTMSIDDLVGFKWAASFYDATWALALALTKSLPDLESRGLYLDNYSLGDGEITKIISNKLLDQSEINFMGVSESRVKFECNRETRTTLKIAKVSCTSTGCTEEALGIYNESGLHLVGVTKDTFINDTFQETPVTVHLAIGTILLLAISAVLIITVLIHLTNIVYYNFKPIKATSPNLSHLIFSGCYLLLVSMIFFVIKDVFDFSAIAYGVLCNLYTLCISLGFTLVFGTICAKIWRVYRIFRHFRSERAGGAISDNALILFVILLLFVDMSLGIIWILFDPWLQKTSGEFIGTEIIVTSTCTCNYTLVWILVISAYKGLLILVVVLLAILNRKIQRKEFKHTKKVSMYVYTEILMAGITLPIFQVLSGINFTASLIVLSLLLLATVCGCLGFVFFPSVLPLIKIKYRGQPVTLHMTRRSTVLLLN